MKLRKIIIIIVFFIFTLEVLVSDIKAWGSLDHRARVEQIINTRLPEVYFSNKELELLYKSVILPDAYEYRNPDGRSANNLHGRGNYVATLKYIYELAFKYLDNQSKVDDAYFIKNYFEGCSYLSASERENIDIVNSSLIKLVTTKILYDSSDYELSNRKKAIKIFGFACHLAGDIYAHDTIVPENSVSYNKYDQSINFKQSDFTSTTAYSSLEKWNTFKEIISRFDVAFLDLDNLNTASVTTESGSVVKLKTLYNESLLAAIAFDLRASLYEDNPNFHSIRYDATFTVTKEIITKFNDALLARENDKKLDGTFNKDILNYYSKHTNSAYRLRNFENFYSVIE